MKYTPAELRLIKRFNNIVYGLYDDEGVLNIARDFLIKEVRRARRAGFKECDKWIQSREYNSLAEIMKPQIKNGVINGECPKCGGASDGMVYTSNPPQKKCSICGTYWFYTVQTKDRSY